MLRMLKERLEAGASAEEEVSALFSKINKSRLNAYNVLSEEAALERAREYDRSPWGGLLAGVPIAIKSSISKKGVETTYPSGSSPATWPPRTLPHREVH